MKMFHLHLRKLLLGNLPFVHSLSAYKRMVLTSILAIITTVISLMFLILDFKEGTPLGIGILAACSAVAIISVFLNRSGKHLTAKIMLNLSVNFTVFLFSESEPMGIGLYLFFIVTAIGSIAGFGFEEMPYAIFGLFLSLALFILSLYTDFNLIPKVSPPYEEYILLNLSVNFIVSFSACAVIVYFLVRLDYQSEYTLEASQRELTRKNEELIKVNAELDRFVYSTSHDLRSPISSILGLIQLTKTTRDQKELDTYIQLMEGRLTGLNKFIKDISDYSRNARTEVVYDQVKVRPIIEEILSNLLYMPGAEKIKRYIEVQHELELHTDATRLHIILSNLIANAFKYSDPAKPASFVRISAHLNGDQAELIVEDNGVGIEATYLPRIFDMFFRAHQNSEGSGLGLYIVRESVSKLNGTVQADSVQGKGTRISVRLPVNSPHA